MDERDPFTEQIIGAAIEVHRILGPGLLESVYQKCFCHELKLRGIEFESPSCVPIIYKGAELDCDLWIDVLFVGKLIVELKAIDALHPVHEAQLLTYMKLASIRLGLLINFNVPLLKSGIKRMIL